MGLLRPACSSSARQVQRSQGGHTRRSVARFQGFKAVLLGVQEANGMGIGRCCKQTKRDEGGTISKKEGVLGGAMMMMKWQVAVYKLMEGWDFGGATSKWKGSCAVLQANGRRLGGC